MKIKIFIKSILIIFLSFLLITCDPPRYYDYFITNNCIEDIVVIIEACSLNCRTNYAHKYKILNILINPNSTQLILSEEYFKPLNDCMVEYYFENIIVTKGNDTSKINYVNKDLWEFKKTSKNHANSYLTINPKDFE